MSIEGHVRTETLLDFLHGELVPEDDARVHEHIASCASCRSEHDAQVRITEALRAHAYAEERDLPPRVVARVREHIDPQRRPAWWQHVTASLRPAVAMPVAAVLLLAAILGFSSIRPAFVRVPTIAAAYYIDDHAALSTRFLPFAQTAAVPATLNGTLGSTSASVAAADSMYSSIFANE
jgi:anti-sigma factor RsiW